MTINQFDNLYLKMTKQVKKINEQPVTFVSKLSSSLAIIQNSLAELKNDIETLGFIDEANEIHVFKIIIPKFYSWQFFLVEQFNILSNIPVGTDEMIRNYYIEELNFVKRFFNQNSFLYQYYINGESAKDDEYFLIKNNTSNHNSIHVTDWEFSTSKGYDIAKIIGYEMLQDFLLNRIKLIDTERNQLLISQLSAIGNRKWTDDKINLIELAYGIYFMGSLNNGKAEISDIVDWLEQSLQIDLGVAYRSFIDISRRKNMSYTRYLDSMREAILGHIVDKNGVTTNSLKKRS